MSSIDPNVSKRKNKRKRVLERRLLLREVAVTISVSK